MLEGHYGYKKLFSQDMQNNKSIEAFFISDVHLRQSHLNDIVLLENFIDYLFRIHSKAQIYFLGDIFDFWFIKASPVKKITTSLIKKLIKYNKENAKVVFFEGNHDIHLKELFSDKYGFEVVMDRKIIYLSDKRIILEHGDLYDPDDHGYLFLRSFLRKSWFKFVVQYLIPSFIISLIGNFFSNLSSKSSRVRSDKVIKQINVKFMKYAQLSLARQNAQVFIAGHTHERFFNQGDKNTIINLGSWYDQKLVLGLSDGEFTFFDLNL